MPNHGPHNPWHDVATHTAHELLLLTARRDALRANHKSCLEEFRRRVNHDLDAVQLARLLVAVADETATVEHKIIILEATMKESLKTNRVDRASAAEIVERFWLQHHQLTPTSEEYDAYEAYLASQMKAYSSL